MNKKSSLYLLLIIMIVMVSVRSGAFDNSTDSTPEINTPNIPVVNITPKLESNFIYDDIDKAVALANIHKRILIIIFGAEWCPYCEVLKKDSKNIKQLDGFIVCFLDTDNKNANQDSINKYRPRSLPTSIAIQKDKEISRKIGYKNKDYLKWLDSL